MRLRLNGLKVIKAPYGRGIHDVTPADVAGQDQVGLAQDGQPLVRPGPDVVPARLRVPREREDDSKYLRAVFETLEAEKLAPERHSLFGTGRSEQSPQARSSTLPQCFSS